MTDLKDCSLQFPDLKHIDHGRNCPKYTEIVDRDKDDDITIDELDVLQMELENLLASASHRMRQLKNEVKTLSDFQENRKEKKVSRGKDTEHKRSRIIDDRPVKKMKTIETGYPLPPVLKPAGSHLNSSTSSPGGRPRAKHSKPVESEVEEQPLHTRSTEVPNKFWQMVETYCGPIPHDTVALLEKMVKPLSEEYFDIPQLGRHFSQVWAEEDLAAEEFEGNRCSENGNGKSSIDKLLKKSLENQDSAESCPFGSLTQRLVSAFVQENIMAPLDTGTDGGKPFDNLLNTDQNNSPKSGKASSAPHTTKLEARIRAELIEQGILDPSSETDKDEDEVLAELKRCQQELRAVGDRNRTIISQLLKLSREDGKKQEIRNKIETVNSEIKDHYRRVFAARQKKRNLMKKEKENAMKSLKERESLIKQLEQLG